MVESIPSGAGFFKDWRPVSGEGRPHTFSTESGLTETRWLRMLEAEFRDLLADNGPRSRVSNVYAIGVPTRYVKIGLADRPEHRLKDLQVGNPDELTLLGHLRGPVGWESFIHDALAGTRLRGEWFSWSEDIDALLEAFARSSLGVFRPRSSFPQSVPDRRCP